MSGPHILASQLQISGVPGPGSQGLKFLAPGVPGPGSQVLKIRLCHMLMYRWVKILFLGIFSPVDRSFNIYQISAVFAKETN